MRRILHRLHALFRREKLDAEMAEEMRLHLEMQAEKFRAAGMGEEEARYAARRQFGGVEQIKEQCRDERRLVWLDAMLRDIRYAWRGLRNGPTLNIAVIGSLALCLGGNVAIFSMLYALVLRPLPFRQPAQLVEVYNAFPKVGIQKLLSNVGQYLDFKAHAPAFATTALWRLDDFTLGVADGPVRIAGAVATADLFDVLGVQPLAGHFFGPGNHIPGADNVAVLTESFWTSHFQRDPGVIGRFLQLDGRSVQIVGIAPRVVEALDARAKLIRPFTWPPDQTPSRTGWSPHLYGRLRPGASIAAAQAQVAALEQHYADTDAHAREFFERTGKIVKVDSLQAQRTEPVQRSLYLLQTAVALLLVIGCVNIANVLLARSNQRRDEFMIRAALGASRGAIAGQLLAEAALLACLGAGLGLGLAWAALGTANTFAAQLLPYALPFSIDGKALAWTAALAISVTIFIGLLPLVRVLRDEISAPAHTRGSSATRRVRVISDVLVVLQVAFALMLLTGAGLLIRSFANVIAVSPGFAPRNVIAARIGVPADKEKSFTTRLDAALRDIPGVTASLASSTPFLLVGGYTSSMPLGTVTFRDNRIPSTQSQPSVYYCGVTPSYREVMRIPLRQGRWFNDADLETGRAVVVDEGFARRFFPQGNALGQRLVLNHGAPTKDADWLEIVGIVGDVRHNGVDDDSGQPFLYQPISQVHFYGTMSVFLRTARSPSEIVPLLRKTVAMIDPTLPIVDVRSLSDIIGDSFGNRRGVMLLLGSFAGIALLLSGIGIYGVLAYDVSQRTREIGIRTAIGATRRQIGSLIMGQTGLKFALGISLGVIGTAAASRLISSLLFDVQPTDPAVYVATIMVLLGVALLASWLPARRAMNVDPIVALRCE